MTATARSSPPRSREAGGEPVAFGAFPDDEAALRDAVRRALDDCDMVVLSGGTSKGAGDLSHRIVSKLGEPGILVHGVALKPGKPLCLAVAKDKPIVVLPGFPTSAIFTFHAFVAPVIRARAGLPPEAAETVEARVPVRIASEMGRKEFVLVSLVADAPTARSRSPRAKGSGAVTSFSQADGFIEIDALATALDADTQRARHADRPGGAGAGRRHHGQPRRRARRGGRRARPNAASPRAPSRSAARAASPRRCAANAMSRRCISSIRDTGIYNKHLLAPGLSLVKGWQRMQGVLFRPGDKRFEGKTARAGGRGRARRSVLPDGQPQRRRRHARADRQAARRQRPPGYSNQPRSHNAVAAAVAQARADWGVAIEPVAKLYGLGFLPLAPEEYDFLLVESRDGRARVSGRSSLRCATNEHESASARWACSRPMLVIGAAYSLLPACGRARASGRASSDS